MVSKFERQSALPPIDFSRLAVGKKLKHRQTDVFQKTAIHCNADNAGSHTFGH